MAEDLARRIEKKKSKIGHLTSLDRLVSTASGFKSESSDEYEEYKG